MRVSVQPCIVDGCEKPRHARGLCGGHYSAWYHGADLPVLPRYGGTVDGNGERLYTSVQVCSALGISYRQLDYWMRSRLLALSDWSVASGSGSRRMFTTADIEALRPIAEARNFLLPSSKGQVTIEALVEIAETQRKAALYDELVLAHHELLELNRRLEDALAERLAMDGVTPIETTGQQGPARVEVRWEGESGYYWANPEAINREIAQEFARSINEGVNATKRAIEAQSREEVPDEH